MPYARHTLPGRMPYRIDTLGLGLEQVQGGGLVGFRAKVSRNCACTLRLRLVLDAAGEDRTDLMIRLDGISQISAADVLS